MRAQELRVQKEDERFVSRLPKDPTKQQKAMIARASRPYAERLLDGWRESYESQTVPKSLPVKKGVKITGRWKRAQGVLGSAFRIDPKGTGYLVKFATWDGKGSEVFYRKAVLKGAVLQLDRPVFDVVEEPFSKIYVVVAGKDARLLPSSDVALLEKLAKTSQRARAIASLTFRRI